MASFVPDDIDFTEYMASTDTAHKMRSAGAFVDDVIEHFHGERGPVGDTMPWGKTHNLIRFRPAEVTLWSGLNGHGKSLLLGQACLGLAEQGKRVAIASFEMRPAITLARMARQASATNKPAPDFIRAFHRATDKRIWLYDQQGSVKTDKVLAVVRYCADKLKINHFVIDSLLKCGIAEDGFTQQKDFVDALTVAARDTGIHVHLVAHARKGRDEMEAPGKMDVRGAGAITDQVDNVLTCWRNKPKERAIQQGDYSREKESDALLICDKQRNGEWEGRIALWFDPKSTQFLENGVSGPMNLLDIEGG